MSWKDWKPHHVPWTACARKTLSGEEKSNLEKSSRQFGVKNQVWKPSLGRHYLKGDEGAKKGPETQWA